MRRLTAARVGQCGLQIFNLPQVAARLAGGFLYPITPELLEPAIQAALDKGGFAELDSVRSLPGMTRAVARTLRHAWNADIDLAAIVTRDGGAARLSDLAMIEQRVREQVPPTAMLPRDIQMAALEQVHRAPAALGPIRIERLSWIAPLWRPLVNRLCAVVPVEWEAPAAADTSWFTGSVTPISAPKGSPKVDLVSCADPHHEVVEALRWVRNLLSAGLAKPSEIALAAASPDAWDEHFLGRAADTGMRIHFSHGVPALSTRDGQRCGALADILLRGLSEARVRRLVSLCAREGSVLDQLPSNWLTALPRGATLLTLGDWQRALTGLKLDCQRFDAETVLLPWLGVLEKGPEAAREAAASTLRGRSQRIWEAATRSAPAHAIELTLQNMRLPEETDAGDSVVWCPAAHLAASPRPWVRLLGLTSRAWPRRGAEDPILPDHLVSAKDLDPDPMPEADRRSFAVVLASASAGLVLSRNRRSPQGSRVGPSPLLPEMPAERALSRARIPEHAFSEADRLMARPAEARAVSYIASASQCWRDWHNESFTAHDGRYRADHPVIKRALERTQSATSLRLLLRGPLGFLWKYGLGWRAPEDIEQPLTIAPEEFGKLVHEVLRRTVDALEPAPGFASASGSEIKAAMAAAATTVREAWPLERPVPPRLLWSNTVDHGARMAIAALTEEITQSDTKSWTEVPFGDVSLVNQGRLLPWDASVPVIIPDTDIRIQGAIDRLDLRSASGAVRVTDYKTGRPPVRPERIAIGGGSELQRSLYALACRQLLPDCRQVVARLAYLSDPPLMVRLDDLDDALRQISAFVAVACSLLAGGVAVPGRDADAATNDLRLAMPASPGYLRRKSAKFAQAANRLSTFWDAK
jgi:PD-(D/E)XK nuclease superfamily